MLQYSASTARVQSICSGARALCALPRPVRHFSGPAPQKLVHDGVAALHTSVTGPRRVFCAVGAPGSGLNPELKSAIDNVISSNKVVAFIKGTKDFPQCGFSNTVVQILNVSQVPYETVNILEDDRLRSGMKEYSQWPTFPQIYIDGEFFGGCDIMIQSYQSGELKETLERVMME